MPEYTNHLRLAAFFFWVILSAPISATGQTLSDNLSAQLRATIEERLSLMPSVARYKFDNDLPVEDLRREAQILEAAVSQATKLGFDPVKAKQALVAQMAAAKLLQTNLIKMWQHTPEASRHVPKRDLVRVVRPAISRLNTQLLQLLEQTQDGERCALAKNLKDPSPDFSFDPAVWHLATAFLEFHPNNCN